jgi:hypothetical protein
VVRNSDEKYVQIPRSAEAGLTTREDLFEFLKSTEASGVTLDAPERLLAPMESQEVWAEGLAQSVNMGVGQFCTCPGVVIGMGLERFGEQLRARFWQARDHADVRHSRVVSGGCGSD